MTRPDCPRCGYQHERCTAHNRAGNPCRMWPLAGADVCKQHGGKAPQVLAAAAVRVQHAAAASALAALGQPIAVDPGTALLGLIHAKAGEVAWLRDRVRAVDPEALVWGTTRVKDGGDDQGTTTEAKPSVWWQLLRSAEDQLAAYASAALKAGVEERRVRLAESQGALVADVIRGILDDLDLTAAQLERVPVVVPARLRALDGAVPA